MIRINWPELAEMEPLPWISVYDKALKDEMHGFVHKVTIHLEKRTLSLLIAVNNSVANSKERTELRGVSNMVDPQRPM